MDRVSIAALQRNHLAENYSILVATAESLYAEEVWNSRRMGPSCSSDSPGTPTPVLCVEVPLLNTETIAALIEKISALDPLGSRRITYQAPAAANMSAVSSLCK